MQDKVNRHRPQEQDPQIRRHNFSEVSLGYNLATAIAEAARCLNCKNPLCRQGCPVQIDIPAFIQEIKVGEIDKALEILKEKRKLSNGSSVYSFSRGVEIYPTVGDPVLLPSQDQLKAIVESGENRRVNIGISPLAGNAVVSIDPDRLFGRHLAILGNTGSGKSCTVAGVIRWSIEAAG